MPLKPGLKVILQLGSFFKAPRWREALILRVEGKWLRTLVRCTAAELAATELTAVEHGGSHFCLVEAELHHLKWGTHEEYMMLDADSKTLLNLGKVAGVWGRRSAVRFSSRDGPAQVKSEKKAPKPAQAVQAPARKIWIPRTSSKTNG